jgi:RNase P/RNase MRP subunit p29
MQLLDDVLLGNTVGTDAIAPWNANLEPTQGIIPQLDANRLTGIGGTQIYAQSLTLDNSDNIILPDASPTLMAKALTTDSNTSLPDSSVDLLTGQAMSEVYEDLSKFAAEPDFVTKMNLAFGENWDAAGAKALAEGWFNRDFSAIPPVKVVSSAEIAGANGAFAAATDTIYLSKEFLAENAMNPAAVADVLLEEIGHSVDARLNVTDSQGDEGAIFGAVVQGKELSEGELQGLRSEDDRASILLGGEDTTIEMNQQQWTLNSYVDWRNQNFNWEQPNNISYQNGYRSDGKEGIYRNWKNGSPFDPLNTDIVNPLDYFATSGSTQANFEAGKTYKFRVSADDNLVVSTTAVGKSDSNWITPLNQARQPEWQTFPYGIFKEYSWTPTQSGSYDVKFWHYDITGDAGVDIFWEKTGQAQSDSPPAGFTAVKSGKGVNLYESTNKSDYVQVVDLSQGASIKLLTGQQTGDTQTGYYGGTSPTFKKDSLQNYWDKLSSANANAFSVSNGAFFENVGWPFIGTELSYPLKIFSSTGYSNVDDLYPGGYSTLYDGSKTVRLAEVNKENKLKLESWNDRASITKFEEDTNISSLKNSSAPQALVGLDLKVVNNQPTNRTLIGLKDRDSNGTNETVLILNSENRTKTDANQILMNFGASKVISLDGSGSTQMITQGKSFVKSSDSTDWTKLFLSRDIPQAIGVVSG